MTVRVMLIDHQPGECAGLVSGLASTGYAIVAVADCDEALARVRAERPAVVLVRRLSRDVFRHDYCRQLRQAAAAGVTAIVALLPNANGLSATRCLENGADDAIGHDIDVRRLATRIRSLRAGTQDDAVLRYGPLEMDLTAHRIRAEGKSVPLDQSSFQVLRSFLERPEQILTRDDLLSACTRIATGRSLYAHVRMLRDMIASLGLGSAIVTVPRSGYMLSLR